MNILRPSPAYNIQKVAQGVIRCARAVGHELGAGLPLENYESALARLMQQSTLKFARQYPFGVPFYGPPDRGFYADFVVETWVLVELKRVNALTAEHVEQVQDYLRESGCQLCILINFGKPKVEIRRVLPTRNGQPSGG